MKRDDPKRLKLQADRERTSMWLSVLCNGFGQMLEQEHYPEGVRSIIAGINTELVEAVNAAQRAEDAYRPYWSRRRRMRINRAVKHKKGKAA